MESRDTIVSIDAFHVGKCFFALDMSMPQILITGGAGFLGAHMVRAFLEAGKRVRVLDVAAPPVWANQVDYVQGGVCDLPAVRRAVQGVESVIHAAFASPRQSAHTLRAVNVDGTRLVYEAARDAGARRFVLISSTIVERLPRRHPCLPRSGLSRLDDYRACRAEAEAWLLRQSGPPVAAVRPKTFLGPGKVGAFAMMFDAVRRGDAVPVMGVGANRYQLLDIRDMAEGVRLLEGGRYSGVYHFGAEIFGTVRQDLQVLIDHANSGARLRFLPGTLAKTALRGIELAGLTPLSEWHYFSAWGKDSVVDISREQRELGWNPARSNARALIEAYDAYSAGMREAGRVETTHPIPISHKVLRGAFRLFDRG